MPETKTDILILGAGIAGYEAYRTLQKELKKHRLTRRITIVDQNNYFTFTPLLHEVAAGSVQPTHASFPIRELTANTPHEFIYGTVSHIDPKKKMVTMRDRVLHYKTCIIALGSTSNMYNVSGAEEYTYRVRTLEEATALNAGIASKLEEPNRTSLNINVIGGGYTGIEIASEFAQLNIEELKWLYPHINVTIHIIQATDRLVPLLPARARHKITKRLKKLGVTTYLSSPAKQITETSVIIGEGTVLPNDITVWVTGFTTKAPEYLDAIHIERDRVPVTNHLHLSDYPDTYAIGDMALIRDPDNVDTVYPQLGEAAQQAGMYVAKHIISRMRNKPHHHFHFKSRGQLMPVGEWYGIGIFGPIVLSGRLMWWLRRTVYVMFMPGIIRKLRIIADWTFVSNSTRHLTRLSSK